MEIDYQKELRYEFSSGINIDPDDLDVVVSSEETIVRYCDVEVGRKKNIGNYFSNVILRKLVKKNIMAILEDGIPDENSGYHSEPERLDEEMFHPKDF